MKGLDRAEFHLHAVGCEIDEKPRKGRLAEAEAERAANALEGCAGLLEDLGCHECRRVLFDHVSWGGVGGVIKCQKRPRR